MGKKITKANRKQKLQRSSSIQKTIDEGKSYITNFDKNSRIRKSRKQNTNKVQRPSIKAKKAAKPKRIRAPKRMSAVSSAPRVSIPATAAINARPTNIGRTGSKNSQIIQQQLHDRLTKHKANIGKLNFSLRWWDPNDLDLHVICPCGFEICYYNKKCATCGGQLDIDMNNSMNPSLQPVQHVYFNKPKPGLYKFFVQYFSGPKQYMGKKGDISSKYALSLHQDVNQIFRYEDNVSQKQKQMHYDYNC